MISALKDIERHTAVSIKAKEVLVYKLAFPKSPANLAKLLILSSGTAHMKVTPEVILQTLMTQVVIKVFKPDKINFKILQMIWGWNKSRMRNMAYHTL